GARPPGLRDRAADSATSAWWAEPCPGSWSADILKLSPDTAEEAARSPWVVAPPRTAAATKPGMAARANLRQRVPPLPSFGEGTPRDTSGVSSEALGMEYLQCSAVPEEAARGSRTCAEARLACYVEHTLLGGSDGHYNT